MKLFLLAALSLLLLHRIAISQPKAVFDQLVAVNKQWLHQQDVHTKLKHIPAQVLEEQGLITQHLTAVETLLRRRKPAGLTPVQVAARARHLDVLRGYIKTGVFPKNYVFPHRQPVFIDPHETFCAVGFLMQQSGAEAMARAIHQSQNYSYLAGICHPQLDAWVQASGLSAAELALIQPTYGDACKTRLFEMHYNNTGTDVNEYVEIRNTGDLITSLLFTDVLFYDENGVLYKTLPRTGMQYVAGANIFTYLFPANESFADRGRIAIVSSLTNPVSLISSVTYNENEVTVVDNTTGVGHTQVYAIGESETTPAGHSLQFTGTCYIPQLWNLHSIPATINAMNAGLLIVPVKLSVFRAATFNRQVNLDWTTAFEQDNRFFELERSYDGQQFARIATISGAGNSNTTTSYRYTDTRPGSKNFYRLKFAGSGAQPVYSSIIRADVDNGFGMAILQNPVRHQLQVQVALSTADLKWLAIYDRLGRLVHQQNAVSGVQTVATSLLRAGQYVLCLHTQDGRLLKEAFIKAQ